MTGIDLVLAVVINFKQGSLVKHKTMKTISIW